MWLYLDVVNLQTHDHQLMLPMQVAPQRKQVQIIKTVWLLGRQCIFLLSKG